MMVVVITSVDGQIRMVKTTMMLVMVLILIMVMMMQ